MSVAHLTQEFAERLFELQQVAAEVTELADQFSEVCSGLSPAEYASLSLQLRDARDAAGRAKSRCTMVRDRVNMHFVVAITDEGATEFETSSHKFFAGADGFFAPPSPIKFPDKFKDLYAWLNDNGHDPNAVLFSKKALTTLCKNMMKAGMPMPPNVKEHTVASITIRQKKE